MPSGPGLVYGQLSFPIHRLSNTIGRRTTGVAPTVDLTPLDRDRVVSRRHAEIEYRDGDFFLIDVEARNGVFVNGDRMAAAAERQLRDSDSISFGGVALTFRRDAAWPDGLQPSWLDDAFGELTDATISAAGTLSGQLHRAIEADELVLDYQPKVVLATGRMEAVECLLRWNHPVRGRLYPNHFLPLAEGTGYIKAITAWVLEAALRQLAAWQAGGLDVHIAVNISTRDLEDDRLPERVSSLLAATAVAAGDLVIEVTETGLMSDPERAIDNLRRLKATGVKLSIDDFGIGQSSLAYLKELPADELKIDKSFSMTLDANNLAILRSAINVGHDLGMRVIAEGIESEATVIALRELGCDAGQGYFFGRPVTADALAASPLAQERMARR